MLGNSQKFQVDEKYIRPKKANDLMKSAQNVRQTVYIYGPTGFGKTSFVFDFLARRKFEYYSALEPDFMEKDLEGDLQEKKDRIVVLDDLYQITEPEDREALYKVLEALITDPHVWLIMISRAQLPAWIKPLHIKHLFVIISEEDLAFSPKEEEAYLAQWNVSIMSESMKRLHEEGFGHPLYCRITAMRFSQMLKENQNSAERLKEELTLMETTRKDCWDYFETHVYDQWDVEMQEFLMDISIVDTFDLQMAQMITKRNDAGKIILEAQETGSFIVETNTAEDTEYYLRSAMRLSMHRRTIEEINEDTYR
jgi:LuxR family maltose regulon positive regulatory protein